MSFRVLVISDVCLYLEGLARILSEHGLKVVGTIADSLRALDAIQRTGPDVVLVDRAMPGSFDLIHRISTLNPAAEIIVLTTSDDESDALELAESGAAGFVTRHDSPEELLLVLEAASRGELRCSPRIAGALLRRVAALRDRKNNGAIGSLTSREREVLEQIEEGHSNRQIASILGIEVATVKNHVHNLLDKLHVDRRGQAAALSRRSRHA